QLKSTTAKAGFILSALLIIASYWVGCMQPKTQISITDPVGEEMFIPRYLTRNADVGTPEEQAQRQQTYKLLRQKMLANPEDFRPRLQMAQLCMLEARATGEHGHYYPASLKVLDEILSSDAPQDVVFGATSLKASVLLSLHQFPAAKKLARQAIALNNHNALTYGALVDAHVELGEYDQAVEMADKMMSIRPDIRSYSRVSYLRELHGDLTGAIEAMKMAVNAGYPGYEETAWARLTLGELYEKKGDLKMAREHYERILQNRPQYPFAIAALAKLDEQENDIAKAEARLKEAINIIPEVSFYVDLAALYQHTGRQAEADHLVSEILTMLADDEANGHIMGMEYARVYLDLIGDPEQALMFAQKEYEARPANIEVNALLAEIHEQLGNKNKASEFKSSANRLKTKA
ncbi:MAG: tetratricopeptide repeat protein, partial [Bacteroidota bacterium]